jgi:hypothetical protein
MLEAAESIEEKPVRRVALTFLASLSALASAPPAAAQAPTKPDYAKPASWLCRPGAETACTANLDALEIGANGSRTPQPFVPATDPKIDCFYVYPTVSKETTPYADLAASPEVIEAAHAQAGRLASRCRLFVPLYRQTTLAGLDSGDPPGWDVPYADIVAAWHTYLAQDNHGRGVVLIGHSQGTILLQKLIADEIDGKPAQALLVSAFLAGDPALSVPKGATIGGTFKHIPVCTAAAQTGCAYPWGSYLADDATPGRVFGRGPGGGQVAGCANPAAPAGGAGALKAYLPRPRVAPESDPPWIEVSGQLSAACVADAQGDVLRISILPSSFAGLLGRTLGAISSTPGWGLHRVDINLVQGNILDLLDAQTLAWHGPRHG